MHFSWLTLFRYALMIILTAVLAACAVQTPDIAKPVEIATATAQAPTEAATHTPESSDPPQTASEPAAPATGTPVASQTPLAMLFHGIPHGMTEDGFPYLGNADAGLTLIDYSDFL